jgi:hypothetical protein
MEMMVLQKRKGSHQNDPRDDWWTFDYRIAGISRMKSESVPEFRILDQNLED